MSHRAVLHVEDDSNDVLFLRHAWTKVGVLNPLHVATDGDQALRYLSGEGEYSNRVDHPIPCLVLLDLKLPKVSGFDVIKWIRAQPAIYTVPVVVLSASTRADDVHTAHALHANAYLAKPPSLDGWRALVASVKEFWLTLAQTPPECSQFSKPGDWRP
jgi:CheY-like chemotaxis protein